MGKQLFAKVATVLASLFIVFSACQVNPNKRYEFKQLAEATWSKGDTLRYVFFVPEGQQNYNIALQFRLNTTFEQLHLPIGYTINNNMGYNFCDSTILVVAKAPGDFSNFSGSYRQFLLPLPHQFVPPIAGIYTFSVFHQINRPSVRGVENIGITIEKPNISLTQKGYSPIYR